MDKQTYEALLQLNQRFYHQFAGSFSATRGRIQPGVSLLFNRIMLAERILDVGCGNGTLARALQTAGFTGQYVGVDMSASLLAKAEALMPGAPSGSFEFQQGDLSAPGWQHAIEGAPFDWVVSFAMLHHIPSSDLRGETVKAFAELIHPEGRVAVSVWQWQNSSRLRQRVLPWSQAGIEPRMLDEGDVLLDWRAGESLGLRYVHTFSEESLTRLAEETGFHVQESFYSDGKTDDLALYQIWRCEE